MGKKPLNSNRRRDASQAAMPENLKAFTHPASDIFLDDVTVSRRHAQFLRSDHGFKVKDVGSLNGTYVNRERIDEVQLSSGDIVQIGKYRLVYIESVGPATHQLEEDE